MTALVVEGLVKRFGALTAVDDVSFSVDRGEICGFIGPNGAGKTTTMRICATLELPDSGDALIDGTSVLVDPRHVRRRLGFMPDAFGAYPNTTVMEYLDFFARAHGLDARTRRERLEQVTAFTALGPLAEKHVDALSKGMRQRLCLAKTLLHDPALLVLDEPAAGLDPRARVELRELVRALADDGKALLVSSHILSELAEFCDAICIVERGRVRAKGRVSDVLATLAPTTTVFLRVLGRADEALRALAEQPHVVGVRRERDGLAFEVEGGQAELADLLAELVRSGLRPLEFRPRGLGLEDAFLSLTAGEVQ